MALRFRILMLILILTMFGALRWGRRVIAKSSARTTRAAHSVRAAKSTPIDGYAHLPIGFEPNVGQVRGIGSSQVKFRARSGGTTLFVTDQGAVLALERGPVVRMKLVGVRVGALEMGVGELPGRSNYFLGNDPRKWITGVKSYAHVKVSGVYPGVDLVYYGNDGNLEYDFVLSPGANPKSIRLTLERENGGKRGAKLHTDRAGDLVLEDATGGNVAPAASGEVRLPRPFIYQPRGQGESTGRNPKERRDVVEGRWVVDGDLAGFELGAYDRSRTVVIDPVLSYSTYLGGSTGPDFGEAIAVDSAGSAYITGTTCSTDFPSASPFQTANASGGCQDAFVTKLNQLGQLVYSTYLGGTGIDAGNGIAVDSSGDAYVTGITCSSDFPVMNAFQAAQGGSCDAFVTKLNAAGGGLIYSTYLGGTSGDGGYGIAVDSEGSAYISGVTASPDFPVSAGAFQTAFGGGSCAGVPGPPAIALSAQQRLIVPPCPDAFVAKLDPSGGALVYSTYLGGTSDDRGAGIAVDSQGNAYVTGTTCSTDFPTHNPIQAANASGGCRDAFVAKLNAAGSALDYSTYLGGKDADIGQGIAVDGLGEAYITGNTHSSDFPTANALQAANAGGFDGFVTKLNATGAAMVYSTYLGGSRDEFPSAIAVDSFGNVYLAGQTYSSDYPLFDPLQPALAGTFDAFITALAPAGESLLYSTYVGGSGGEGATGIALDSAGTVYIAGSTYSADWPTTTGAYQTACRSVDPKNSAFCAASEVFAAKVSALDVPGAALSTLSIGFGGVPVGASSAPQTVTLRNVGSKALVLSHILIAPHSAFAQANNCGSSLAPGSTCTFNVTFKAVSKGAIKGYLILVDNHWQKGFQFVRLAGAGM